MIRKLLEEQVQDHEARLYSFSTYACIPDECIDDKLSIHKSSELNDEIFFLDDSQFS